jgi:hypothetical protein
MEALLSMKSKLKSEIKIIRTKPSFDNIKKYHSMLSKAGRGFHNYYKAATQCYLDFSRLKFELSRPLKWLLQKKPGVVKKALSYRLMTFLTQIL